MASTGMQGAALGYVGGAKNALNQASTPRSLGFVERATGVAIGLGTLHDRLESLLARIDGNGQAAEANGSVAVPGLGSQISDAENRLRACLAFVDELHAKF